MKTMVRDLRREERRKAEGAVRVSFSNPQPVQVEGELVDISTSGFRMAHGSVALSAGLMVEFSHAKAKGQAQVMWNRVLDNRVETGFRVVDSPK